MQGDEVSLQKVLNMVHKNNHEHVAVLFYASLCPFSQVSRPVFSILSALYPSILHLAIEESSVWPRFVGCFFQILIILFLIFVYRLFQLITDPILAAHCPNMVSIVSLHCTSWILPCGFGIMGLGRLARSLVSTMMLLVRRAFLFPLLILAFVFVCYLDFLFM